MSRGNKGNPHPNMAGLKPIKKGEARNPNGRPKKPSNAIKALPADMQEKVYAILGFALTLPDETAAKKYLEYQQGELGKYGFVLQIITKQLLKEGWAFSALMDILDRLYGKPRIQAEVTSNAGITLNVTTDGETKKAIEEGLG